MTQRILVINPGSSSTKLALYADDQPLWTESIRYSDEEIARYPTIFSQLEQRYADLLAVMQNKGTKAETLNCVVARGGLIGAVPAGAHTVNEAMLDVLEHHPVNHHASNLGAALAARIAWPLHLPCFIYDPVTTDEMTEVTRLTGLPQIKRYARGHFLNMRAAARYFCAQEGKDYQQVNLIVAHLGGGITLSLHSGGRMIDMISDDEGPFSPERAGMIPTYKLVDLIYSHDYSQEEIMALLQHEAGLRALLGTSDAQEAEARALSGDQHAALVLTAMALNVARSIGGLAVTLNGAIDAIIITGAIAESDYISSMIRERVDFIAPVRVLPGEHEMQALAAGALRVLNGEEGQHSYENLGEYA